MLISSPCSAIRPYSDRTPMDRFMSSLPLINFFYDLFHSNVPSPDEINDLLNTQALLGARQTCCKINVPWRCAAAAWFSHFPLSFSVRSAILFMQCQALLLASAVSFPTSVGYDDLMAADARLEVCFYKGRFVSLTSVLCL